MDSICNINVVQNRFQVTSPLTIFESLPGLNFHPLEVTQDNISYVMIPISDIGKNVDG